VAARAIRVPFVDLQHVNLPLRDDILADFSALLERGNFVGGSEVEAFEAAFAAYCGSAHCVGTSNGLDALRLGLLAAGLEPGDEVIVPAGTFIATFEAVVQAGGTPVLVDVSELDYNLDVPTQWAEPQ
jgi:dTDP-3-amino-3,4,6-trideoxy-alpha-D-glucose transaminase